MRVEIAGGWRGRFLLIATHGHKLLSLVGRLANQGSEGVTWLCNSGSRAQMAPSRRPRRQSPSCLIIHLLLLIGRQSESGSRLGRMLDHVITGYRGRRRLNRPILIQSLLETEQICLEFLVEYNLIVCYTAAAFTLFCSLLTDRVPLNRITVSNLIADHEQVRSVICGWHQRGSLLLIQEKRRLLIHHSQRGSTA